MRPGPRRRRPFDSIARAWSAAVPLAMSGAFQHAFYQTHGVKSHLLTREPVVEKFENETV